MVVSWSLQGQDARLLLLLCCHAHHAIERGSDTHDKFARDAAFLIRASPRFKSRIRLQQNKGT